MKTLVLDFYSDAGHGWLKVAKDLVASLDVPVSQFSYQKGEWFYLEEDCDASRFDHAAKNAGYQITLRHHNTDGRSAIRSYSRVFA